MSVENDSNMPEDAPATDAPPIPADEPQSGVSDPRFLDYSDHRELAPDLDHDPQGEETYTSQEAAKILKYSRRQVQNYVKDGKLVGFKDDTGRVLVTARSVHALKDSMPRRRASQSVPEWPVEAEDLIEKVQTLERLLGRLEGERHVQKELSEKTESTLREQLEREIARADRLEAELAEARDRERRGFWSRLFGG